MKKITPLLLRIAFAFPIAICGAPLFVLAQQQPMPDAKVIERESHKQIQKSTAIIERAEVQSRAVRPVVPDVGLSPNTGMPDPAAIAKKFQALTVTPVEESVLYIMVSFSMPDEAIARLAEQAAKTGATLVLRGVVEESLQKTALLASQFIKRYPGVQFQVDPNIYRRYAVKQVPTFILARENKEIQACTKGCDATDYFVSVAGDVTLDYALDYFSRRGGERFSPLAEKRL
jgi:conjugal transfer pilus assembly protein TrbC